MNPKKIWLIAKREYWVNFRRRTFLFTAFGLPIVLGVVMAVVFGLVQSSVDDISGYKSVGLVDQSGLLASEGKPLVKLTKPFVIISSAGEGADLLKAKKIDGYYIIPTSFLQDGNIDAYYNQSAALNDGLRDSLQELLKQAMASRVGDPMLATRLEAPLKTLNVYRIGSAQKLEEAALIGAIFVPIIVGTLTFVMTMGTSQMLMQGLVEEKENRMMELFMTSARPSEMLWGKLVGLGALGITMIVAWLVMGLAFVYVRGSGIDIGQTLANYQLTPGFLVLVLLYTLLGYFLFGALMGGLGATVNAEQESRQVASLISLIGVIPLALSFSFFIDPNGGLPVFLSLFPFTAPIGMLFRLPLTTVPTWQVALSIGLMVVTLLLVMWISARIFRLGMLSYGKRPSLGDMLRGLRGGRAGTLATVAKSKEVLS